MRRRQCWKERPSSQVALRYRSQTGTNSSDVSAYNNLLQTSYQLAPGGVIAFVNGPAAQTPTLTRHAPEKGIKVILIDSPATGMGSCQSSFIEGSNHYQMGVDDGKWLIAHPPRRPQQAGGCCYAAAR